MERLADMRDVAKRLDARQRQGLDSVLQLTLNKETNEVYVTFADQLLFVLEKPEMLLELAHYFEQFYAHKFQPSEDWTGCCC